MLFEFNSIPAAGMLAFVLELTFTFEVAFAFGSEMSAIPGIPGKGLKTPIRSVTGTFAGIKVGIVPL